jgi:protein CpxP
MTKKTFYILLIAILLLGNVVLFALFLRGPGPRGKAVGPKEIVIEKLHFDAEQIGEYEALIEAHQTKVHSADEKMNRLKAEMYLQLKGDVNQHIIDSLQHELTKLQANIEAIHFEHFLGIKAICKPEQLDDFNSLTEEIGDLFSPQRPPRR